MLSPAKILLKQSWLRMGMNKDGYEQVVEEFMPDLTMSNGTSWVYAGFSMTNHLVGSFKYVCYGAHFQYNGMIEIQCSFLATAQKFTKLATQGWVFTV